MLFCTEKPSRHWDIGKDTLTLQVLLCEQQDPTGVPLPEELQSLQQ